MKTRIILDSTADITPEIREKCSIVPLTVNFGMESYLDGVTIDHQSFYEKLVECDVLPTTSQPSPEAFANLYADCRAKGEQAVVLTVSSKLSGTYQSAHIAAMDYPETAFVVDSKTVAIGTGILAELAVRLAESGMEADALVRVLTQQRENVRVIAMLDTLEYLKKGGRISKTVAFAGELLSIKPVVTIEDGEIKILGKARGSRQANNLLVKEIEQSGGVDFGMPVLLGYTGLSDVLLQKYISDSAPLWEQAPQALRVCCIGSVIGTHAGPGAVAAAYFRKG